MIKITKYLAAALGGLIVVLIAAPLLWILGRSEEEKVGELVVDPDVDSNDAGEDVDEQGDRP